MGKVNVCLKRSYIMVISVIATLSALMLAVTLFTHGRFSRVDDETETMLPGLQLMYSISIITLILAIIGVYGACKEKKWALIMFAVGMILGTLFLIASDIQALAQRPKVAEHLKMHYMMLQNNASGITDDLRDVHIKFQCCGLDQGYLDWGYDIPESCLCTEESTNPCGSSQKQQSV
uniref:Tetraspanin n=1 Tax=Cyclopterus lumpus TaxID=8103 RepID=A0A8C2Z3G1_CYCLU